MARLPIPGSDAGNWGQILNDYLSAAHGADGKLKPNSVITASIVDGAVTEVKLDSAVQAKLNSVGGSQGATGPQGPAGTNGTNGSQGATGPQGASGVQGNQGAQGTAGPAGDQGATGPQGPQGTAGSSVTILGSFANAGQLPPSGNTGDGYLVGGSLYVWTGSAWENVGNIQGPAGSTGPAGTTGAAGPIGATGARGSTGPQGPAGTGNTGATGPQGPAGPGGAGATGPQGPAGTTGAAGPIGATGARGSTGPAGTGATGPTGPQGPAGTAGTAGPQGATGPQGPAGSGANWNIRAISSSTVNAANGDWIVATPSSSAITVSLPAPAANARVRVKRNSVAGNSILITTPNGGMLDGGEPTMATLNAGWSSMDYESDGTNWYTV